MSASRRPRQDRAAAGASSPHSVLARSLKEQKNLNSFFAVMFGVSNTAVSRLAKTWEVTSARGLRPALRGDPPPHPPRGLQ